MFSPGTEPSGRCVRSVVKLFGKPTQLVTSQKDKSRNMGRDKINSAEKGAVLSLFLDGCHAERVMLATIQNLPDKLYLGYKESA